MFELVDQLEKKMDAAGSLDQALASLTEAGNALGFDMSVYFYAPRPRSRDGTLRLPVVRRTYPTIDGWDHTYTHRQYFRHDPVYSACLHTTLPVIWSFTERGHHILGECRRFNAFQQQLACEAAKSGVRNGIAVPLHLPHGELAVVGFLSDADSADFYKKAVREKDIALLLAHHFHHRVGEVLDDNYASDMDGIILSRREIECLQWASYGKTNDDIASILDIAEITVRVHLKNASQKLGTINRTHTVGKALSVGLIKTID